MVGANTEGSDRDRPPLASRAKIYMIPFITSRTWTWRLLPPPPGFRDVLPCGASAASSAPAIPMRLATLP
jgi:hypothetical protein